jgi:hypothetical protein
MILDSPRLRSGKPTVVQMQRLHAEMRVYFADVAVSLTR